MIVLSAVFNDKVQESMFDIFSSKTQRICNFKLGIQNGAGMDKIFAIIRETGKVLSDTFPGFPFSMV